MKIHFKTSFTLLSILLMATPLISQEVSCTNPVNCETYEDSLTEEDFRAVSLYDENNGWIMSSTGSLFRYKDGAVTRAEKLGINYGLHVEAVNENLAWAIADLNVFKYDGTKWKKEEFGSTQPQLTKMYAVDAQHAFAIGWHGAFYKYSNGTWTKIQLPQAYVNQYIHSLYFLDENTGWIVTENAILSYKNGTFTETPLAVLGPLAIFNQSTKINFADENEGWVTSGVELHHFKNGIWEVDTTARKLAFTSDVQMIDKNLGLLVGLKPYLQDTLVVGKYINGTWTKLYETSIFGLGNNSIYDMNLVSIDKGLVVGEAGLVVKIAPSVVTTVNSDVMHKAVQGENFDVIPSPASGLVFVEKSSKSISSQHVSVLDAKGTVLMNTLYNSNVGLHVERLPSGLYFLRLHTDHITLKLIKE